MWSFTTAQLLAVITLTLMGGSLIGFLIAGLMQAAAKAEQMLPPNPVANFPHADFPDRRARFERIASAKADPRIQ